MYNKLLLYFIFESGFFALNFCALRIFIYRTPTLCFLLWYYFISNVFYFILLHDIEWLLCMRIYRSHWIVFLLWTSLCRTFTMNLFMLVLFYLDLFISSYSVILFECCTDCIYVFPVPKKVFLLLLLRHYFSFYTPGQVLAWVPKHTRSNKEGIYGPHLYSQE